MFVPVDGLPMGTYTVEILPVSEDGTIGYWSPIVSFVSRTVPVLIEEHGTWFKATRNLQWEPLPGVVGYNVLFRRVVDGKYVDERMNLQETSFVTPELENGNYSWWVQGIRSDGQLTAWSSEGRIFVGTEVHFINLPFRNVSTTLSWNAIQDADHYELLVWSYPGYLVRKILTTNEYVLPPQLAPGSNSARIIAFDHSGVLSVFDRESFEI
jgi:hypothetical protein